MSARTITFQNKRDGDLFTDTEVNMVKSVVNSHATDIDSLADGVEAVRNAMEEHGVVIDRVDADMQVLNQQTQVVGGVKPGPLYLWPQPVTSLTLDKAAGQAGCQNEYKLQFTVSGSSFSLSGTLTQNVRWLEEPDWEEGFTYQISILNNLGICAGWEAAQS